MKKVIKQSTLIYILNAVSVLSLLLMVIFLIWFTNMSSEVQGAGHAAGALNVIRLLLYISVAIVILLQVLTSYFTRKRIMTPLLAIENEMVEISQGNLSAAFSLEPDTSEIGMLTDAIHTTKRELKKYIDDIDGKLAKMAQGDMDLSIGTDYKGEFLPIQSAMRSIVDALNYALSEISTTSEQIAFGSQNVAGNAQELTQGVNLQATAVQELSDNVKVLGESLQSMASNAKEAHDCSEDAGQQIQNSNDKMNELSVAISNISEASGQISGIIKIIEDIAFQTNILALNAAVEAARAGDAGKGFAVVADEVRNLAAKSAEAAQSTAVLIENMLKQMQQGTELTQTTTEALFKVVAASKQSTDLVDEIASETNHQLGTLNEVLEGISSISDVVESNSGAAEEFAASAEELSGQAGALKNSLNRFRLKENVPR